MLPASWAEVAVTSSGWRPASHIKQWPQNVPATEAETLCPRMSSQHVTTIQGWNCGTQGALVAQIKVRVSPQALALLFRQMEVNSQFCYQLFRQRDKDCGVVWCGVEQSYYTSRESETHTA